MFNKGKFKKIYILTLAFLFAFALGAGAAQSEDPEGSASYAITRSEAAASALKVGVTTDSIRLDGESVSPAGYNINGNNFFKLRDIAYLMNGKQAMFGVGWDAQNNRILLTSGQSYEAIGGEMTASGSAQKIQPSSQKVMLDGQEVALTAYNIDGNNYFKLRDIGTKIGFVVDYDEGNKVILLSSGDLPEYTVSFDMNGMGTQIEAITGVKQGSLISAPAAPSASGYSFGGWYQDSALTTQWDFAADNVEQDITLYAQWLKVYTVSFDLAGYGSHVNAQSIAEGGKVTQPATPTHSGMVFSAWYSDVGYTKVWNFATDTVSSNMVLYGLWLGEGEENPGAGTGTTNNASAIDGVMTLILDPGHGGTDGGGKNPITGQDENVTNLAVAQYLQTMLENAGVKVIMTRTDLTTSIAATDRKATVAAYCAQGNIDLVVSIHHNSFNTVARGAELLVPSEAQEDSGRSDALARMILEEYRKLGQSIRGVVERPNLYMLSTPASYGVPAIMSEFCFLDNEEDILLVNTPEGQYAEAQALYNAIMHYFSIYEY